MKIDTASVPNPSQMEPVTTKGHDGEESPHDSGFRAEITRLTTTADGPHAVDQRGNTETKATVLLRNDLPRMDPGEPDLSQSQPQASAEHCTIPAAFPVAIEDADSPVRELEESIEWFMACSGDFIDADTPEATAKAGEPAEATVTAVSGQRGGGTDKAGLAGAALSGGKVRIAQPGDIPLGTDLIGGTTSPLPLTEIPQNIAAATSPDKAQPAVQVGSGPDGESPARSPLGFTAQSFETTLTSPQASTHVTSASDKSASLAGSCDPGEADTRPLPVDAHDAATQPVRSAPKTTLPIADSATKGFQASESSKVSVTPPSRTVAQTQVLSTADPEQSEVPGTPSVSPPLQQSAGTETAALRTGGSTPDIVAPRLSQKTKAEAVDALRVGSSSATSRDSLSVSSASRAESVPAIREAASATQGSETLQAGIQAESVERATPKAVKDNVPTAGTQRSASEPSVASDTLPDRTGSSQTAAAKDSARSITQSVMPHKQASAKEAGPVQNLTPGRIQAGETSPGIQSRPVSATTNRLPEFISQLADRLQLQIQRGENQIRIQLKPESLGLLQITAVNGIDGIVGRIATESGRVREYLDNNLPILQQNLQEQGLKVDRIEVVLQDSFDARQPNAQHQPLNHSGRGNSGDSSRRSPGATRVHSRTSLDGFAVDPLSRLTLGPDSTFHTIA